MTGPGRIEPAFPNTGHVARREYRELVRSRLFHVSTVTLGILAIIVALIPMATRLAERGSVTRVAVVASDPTLSETTIRTLSGVLNQSGGGAKFELTPMSDPGTALQDVDDHVVDGAILVQREPSGRLSTTVQLGETMGNDSLTNLTVGMFGVAILDFMSQNPQGGFELPTTNIVRALGGGGGTAEPSAYASRLIVGMLFGVLIFITIVIYGMWVAAGVVAEKSSRVMELLISAASPRQLVLGKAIGIGLAGATQYVLVLVPAVLVLIVEDRIADAVLGPSGGISLSLGALSPALFLAFGVFYALGFALYSLVYAAAGSLVSRPEDLQIIALPLSIVAIAGYLQAILALTGGITWFIRIASFVPFWSPFVMLTRLSIGRVSPLELVVSVALLVVTIVVVGIVAIRIYGAGVLLYGQRPGFRAYVEAARRG